MFDVAPTELMLVALIALVVIGPKDLPRVMRVVGQWVARARGMARHFRSGMDEMIRQSEIEEMERKWAEENARIMREHPSTGEDAAPQMAPLTALSTDAGAGVEEASDDDPGAPAELPAASASSDTPAAAVPASTPPPSPQAELPLGGMSDRPA